MGSLLAGHDPAVSIGAILMGIISEVMAASNCTLRVLCMYELGVAGERCIFSRVICQNSVPHTVIGVGGSVIFCL